ncbi:MAG: hypothetical protein P1U46_04340 [Patescibacteria group bacterium]|nr:hypothetical protein [Patescibacteria group bacterium]
MIFKSDISSFSEQYEDIFSISKKIDLYDSIYSEVISDRKNVENLNNQLFEKITSLEDSIAELDKDIESTSKKITQINSEVIQIKRNIEINEKTIDTLRTKINENKEILLKYLAYIYKK